MPYRCEAASIEGFVQQLACNLVNKGYWYYVVARIPEHKNPLAVDEKLVERYGLDVSKWARARRKQKGFGNVAYLRHERFFVLIATAGSHPMLELEGGIRDIRRSPIGFHGYSIGCGKGSDGRYHSSVMLHREAYEELRAYFLEIAIHRSAESLAQELQNLSLIPFARVRRQLLRLLREVNDLRRTAGYEQIPGTALRLRRTIYKVFTDTSKGAVA